MGPENKKLNIEKGNDCQTLFETFQKRSILLIAGPRPFTFPETKNKINEPSNKWNEGDNSP